MSSIVSAKTTVVKYQKLEIICNQGSIEAYREGKSCLDDTLITQEIYKDAKLEKQFVGNRQNRRGVRHLEHCYAHLPPLDGEVLLVATRHLVGTQPDDPTRLVPEHLSRQGQLRVLFVVPCVGG